MASEERTNILQRSETVVVKVGTNVLADHCGRLDRARIQSLVEQLVRLRTSGRRIALVTSGAIGAGMGMLNLAKRPTELPELQACAALGQSALMHVYQELLAPHGIHPGQLLLTAGDFDHRARYLNARHTILTLFEYGALPVINENDTVSVAEIKFGDNDYLAALVANLIAAPLLILLTNVDGLYSADPRVDPNAKLVPTVREISSVSSLAGSGKSHLGTGGMKSKLKAARVVTAAGSACLIANGSHDGILDRLFAGEAAGTLFLPHGEEMPAWKRWLGFTARPKGRLILDPGAVRAVVEQGKSLLPVGVRSVQGTFGKGDVVALDDHAGTEIGRGLSNYPSETAARIRGLKADQITATLGPLPYAELIHRNNLAVIPAIAE